MPTQTQEKLIQDLVVSILAVNSYPLDRAFALLPRLEKNHVFDLDKVATWDHSTAIAALVSSGYDRGGTMNSIFASRIQELGLYKKTHGLDSLFEKIRKGDQAKVEEILLKMHGIGPAVVSNFWVLQDSENKK